MRPMRLRSMFGTRLRCPFCYREVNRREVRYRCSGRNLPGREPCEIAVDPDRRRETGYQGVSRRVFTPADRHYLQQLWPLRIADCDRCGAPSGERACPHCHSTLPSDFADSQSPLIAVVGAYGTGKTVYFTVLAHLLLNRFASRFDASVELFGDQQGGSESGREWINGNIETLFSERYLFPQTSRAVGGRKEPVLIQWRRRTPFGVKSIYLSFYDTAGEDLGGQDRARELRYLSAADGVVVLLDPFTLRAAREEIGEPAGLPESVPEPPEMVLQRVTEALREGHTSVRRGQITLPVAAAFAKIDAFFDHIPPQSPIRRVAEPTAGFDEATSQEIHEHVQSLLQRWDGMKLDQHLRLNYRDFRYFAVSALGEPPDYAQSRVSPRGVRPLRVEDPLLWLLSRLGTVPLTKGR